jgi:hypothetical protein
MGFTDVINQIEDKWKTEREEEQKRTKQGDIFESPITKALLGGGLGYITGGLAPALMGGAASISPVISSAIPATGPATAAGVGATATQTALNLPAIIGAIEGAKTGYESKTPEEAALGGAYQGALPTLQAVKRKMATEAMRKIGLEPQAAKAEDITYGRTTQKGARTIEELGPIPVTKLPSGYAWAPTQMNVGGQLTWVWKAVKTGSERAVRGGSGKGKNTEKLKAMIGLGAAQESDPLGILSK